MCPAGVVKTSVVEVSSVVSFKERAIVFKVEPVMVVTIPGGVIIIGIAGKICFAYCGGGIIATCIDNGCRYGGSYVNPGSWNAEPNAGADKYLCITFSSNEAGGYDGGEDK